MCRNIRNLHNFEPPATDEEIHASALQYVRKISGFTKPSQANAEAFERAGEGPRGRGREGPRSRRAALRGVAAAARLPRRAQARFAGGT
jgi:hypothetical protein